MAPIMLKRILVALTLSGLLAGMTLLSAAAAPLGQGAATPVPFATLTPPGPQVEAFDDVNVRSGPGTEYDLIGIMVKVAPTRPTPSPRSKGEQRATGAT